MRIKVKKENVPALKSILLTVRGLVLNEFVDVGVLFEDEKYVHVLPWQVVTVIGDDYKAWGSDDRYIVDYILQKFELEEIVE